MLGYEGTHPNGTVAISFASVICNTGTAGVDWQKPMQAHHPFIAFMIAREDQGRFEQVSDHGFSKHGYAATNASDCATCSDTSNSNVLAVRCSDIYDTDDNGDRYLLGPPGELDPWLGEWNWCPPTSTRATRRSSRPATATACAASTRRRSPRSTR